jgi:hypothetical protein
MTSLFQPASHCARIDTRDRETETPPTRKINQCPAFESGQGKDVHALASASAPFSQSGYSPSNTYTSSNRRRRIALDSFTNSEHNRREHPNIAYCTLVLNNTAPHTLPTQHTYEYGISIRSQPPNEAHDYLITLSFHQPLSSTRFQASTFSGYLSEVAILCLSRLSSEYTLC